MEEENEKNEKKEIPSENGRPEIVYVHPLVNTVGELSVALCLVALLIAVAMRLGGIVSVRSACGTCDELRAGQPTVELRREVFAKKVD